MFSLFPKDGRFYELFEKQAEKLSQASALLNQILADPQKLEALSVKLKELETEADNLGHDVMDNLRRNFITPLDGEDIDLLRQNLDNIMDKIERVVNRMVIYNISRPFPKEIKNYADVISEAVAQIMEGVKEIKQVGRFRESLHERCKKLNDLENVGDEINRRALKDLMGSPDVDCTRLMEITKLKEIFETLEDAIDCCEDVGNMFESILIKNQ
jgi:predicted phosphate transport protein (TIGR00153 family)